MNDEHFNILIIYLSVGLALLWALINAIMVLGVKLTIPKNDGFGNYGYDHEKNNLIDSDKMNTIASIG